MSTASKVRPALMILVVYFLSTWAAAAPVQAQGAVPDITLTCDQPQPIDVYPGATRSSIINCRIENPTVHQEKVRIQIQAGVLAFSGPATMSIGGGSEVSFQVLVRAELRAPEGQHQVTVSAEVTMANGVPVTSEPSAANVMAIIRQFSRLRVASEVAFLQLRPKVDYNLVFDVYNDGNALDRFNIQIENYDQLNDYGFQLSIPRERESEIYDSIPDRFPVTIYAGRGVLIYSQKMEVLKHLDLQWWKKSFPGFKQIGFPGGHLFPLEAPEKLGTLI